MALARVIDLLPNARQEHYAIGSFSVGNMEMVMGVLAAAEEKKSPVILQVAESRLHHSPLALIGPLMVAAAKESSVPVCVHLDHGQSLKTIVQALSLGFTSVMFDGSCLSLEENIQRSKLIKEVTDAYGAALEGEIGCVGGTEDGRNSQVHYSRVEDAQRFCAQTGAALLAVAIGNAHGFYRTQPTLNIPLLKEISSCVQTPLVLHGGTGISETNFRYCIEGGIRKINIATADFHAVDTALKQHYGLPYDGDYFKASHCMVNAMCQQVKQYLSIFGSEGMA